MAPDRAEENARRVRLTNELNARAFSHPSMLSQATGSRMANDCTIEHRSSPASPACADKLPAE
jgi:hypothetical protein